MQHKVWTKKHKTDDKDSPNLGQIVPALILGLFW